MNKKILKVIDMNNYEKDWPSVIRTSIRGIVYDKENNFAFIRSNQYGEYRFPGGGIEEGETEIDTLVREVSEETGLHIIPSSASYYGTVVMRRKAKIEKNSIFEQHSIYYFCKADKKVVGIQQLEDYEREMEVTLVWSTLDDAICRMNEIEEKMHVDLTVTPFLYRDYCVMKLLKEYIQHNK